MCPIVSPTDIHIYYVIDNALSEEAVRIPDMLVDDPAVGAPAATPELPADDLISGGRGMRFRCQIAHSGPSRRKH